MELQRFCDYRCQDHETIQYLEKRLAVERQLGYVEGMAQATRDQFHTTSWGRSPVWYHGDNEYTHGLQHAAEGSRCSYREEECHSANIRSWPPHSRPPSSSCRNHHGLTCPSTTQHAWQPELPRPSRPTPAETITIKVKTNMWPEPSSIKPSRHACLPLPLEAEATNMKTMVVHIANAPKKPKDVADYHQLWAGLVNGITIPEMFTCIFDVLGQTADIQYYYRMAMGYAEHCRIIAANQGHLQCSTVLAILINLVVLQQQLPHFIQIYLQVLQREPNLPVNNWEQAHRIVTHPAYPRNDLGLMFEPPSSTSNPWVIQTAWSEDQLQTLVLGLHPSLNILQNLLTFTDTFIRMRLASNPFKGMRLEGQTPQTMFSAPFITASPVKGTLTPPSTPSVVSGPTEQNAPASTEDSLASTSTVHTPWQKALKSPSTPSKSPSTPSKS